MSLPKPYYQSDKATLYCGDCLEILPHLSGVDCVVTDPPYSSGGSFRSDRTGKTSAKYLGSYNSTTAGNLPEVIGDSRDSLGWAFWSTLWGTLCYRLLKDGGLIMVFSDWRQLPNCSNVIQAAGFVWRGLAVWDKGGSVRPMSGRLAHQSEFIVWGSRGAMGWDFGLPCGAGVFKSNVVSSSEREHQTEKPVDVLAGLMEICGPCVADPFMGSGTTGVAAISSGRRFVGVEVDPFYCETAKRRIMEAEEQFALFDPPKRNEQLELCGVKP